MDHAPPSPHEEDFYPPNKNNKSVNINSKQHRIRKRGMVLNAALNNISAISWRSVLMVEEIGVSVDNHRPVASQ